MQGQGVLFGQVGVVFGIVIAGVWIATQWTAAALGYQLRLGSPWFDFFGTPVYHPWRLFEWWFFFDAYAPRIFDIGGAIAGGSGLVAVVVAIAMSVWRSRQSKLVTTYGSARWADAADIRKAGLTQPAGVFLGRHDDQYLRHEGPEHVLTFAPTRSGKGVGLVVPTLLSWPASAVIHDIKGENWQITAGWRSRFSHCLLFNPTDPKSAAYNPLLEVRRGAHEVRDVQNIADILVDPEGALERRNHWEKTSHALLVGAILHVLYAGTDKTLRGVANFLSDPACPFELTLHRMMTTRHLGDTPHPVVASAAREVLNKSDNERSGVLSTAMSFLGLYRDPTVAQPADPTAVQNRQDQKEAFQKAGTTETRNSGNLQMPTSPYQVMAGTVIAAALVTGIKSDLPGDVIGTVTEPVYDTATGRYLLIPQGSRIFGKHNSQVAYGQSRVQVVWNRVILPDTSSLTLDNLAGTDPAGYAGLEDGVDWHWDRIFAGAALTTLLGVGAELAAPENRQGGDRVIIAGRDSLQDSVNQAGQEMTRRNLNIQPTLTERPGLPVRIIVNRDLVLRPYQPLFFNRGTSQ